MPSDLGSALTSAQTPGQTPAIGQQARVQQAANPAQRMIQPGLDTSQQGQAGPMAMPPQAMMPPQPSGPLTYSQPGNVGQMQMQTPALMMQQQQQQQQQQPQQQLRAVAPPGGTNHSNMTPQMLGGMRAALQASIPGIDVNSLPP